MRSNMCQGIQISAKFKWHQMTLMHTIAKNLQALYLINIFSLDHKICFIASRKRLRIVIIVKLN